MPLRLILPILSLFSLISCNSSEPSSTQAISEEYYPDEDYFSKRNYPETSFDHKHYFKQIEKAKSASVGRMIMGTWDDQGPGNIGGRINKIAVNPNNDQEIYLGFARGGVYKTTDGGENWTSIFNEFNYLSTSHVEIDPTDSEILYIATGDENISQYPAIGNGVYKSEDGGSTWTNIGLGEGGIISKVTVAATDNNIVYASAMGIPFEKTDDRGVYKSTNGGLDWEQVLFVNDSTGIIDMVVAPDNPDIVYAAGWNRLRSNNISKISGPDAKIWKTEDGGLTWRIMESGLPQGELIRIGLDMFGTDGNTVIASYSASVDTLICNDTGNQFLGIYKTTDGENWEQILTENEFDCGFQGGFAWYFGKVRINPTDENDISLCGVQYWRTQNNGGLWKSLNDGSLGFVPHVDYHDIVYVNDKVFAATDGGAYVYEQATGWRDIENISTNQFYRVAYNPHEPDIYYGGLQDNGCVAGSNDDINNWERVSGGDGFQMQFKASDPSVFYTESQRGNIRRRTDFGNSSTGFNQGLIGTRNWDMQYIISPHDPDLLFTGTDRMHQRFDYEDQWMPISEDLTDAEEDPLGFYQHDITCLSQSPLNPNVLTCGTSDGFVWATNDLGETWTQINDGLPRRYVTEVKTSPTLESTIYVTFSGFKNNDFSSHIFRSDDLGNNWIDISGNLPDLAINDVYILPNTNDEMIAVANEAGVYLTRDGGILWDRLGENLPYIQCLDLEFNPVNNYLIIGTYGRGLQTFDLNQLVDTPVKELASENHFTIYPNPATGVLNINLESTKEIGKFELVNQSGKIISVHENSIQNIDVSDLPKGSYFLRLKEKDQFQIQQFIKI